jgi:hypothetical protein
MSESIADSIAAAVLDDRVARTESELLDLKVARVEDRERASQVMAQFARITEATQVRLAS